MMMIMLKMSKKRSITMKDFYDYSNSDDDFNFVDTAVSLVPIHILLASVTTTNKTQQH